MDLEGINRAVNPNQMKGQNAVVLAMLARRFGNRRGGSGSSGGASKEDLENKTKLMQYQSDLRMHEDAQKAWIKTQSAERAAKFSEESIPGRIKAVRDASQITDAEGNVIGELNISDSTHGISSRGYMLTPKKETAEASGNQADNEAAAQAVSQVAPSSQASSRQGAGIPGWGIPTPTEEPAVTAAQLRSAMARGPKKRVTKKAQRQTQLTFSNPDDAQEQ